MSNQKMATQNSQRNTNCYMYCTQRTLLFWHSGKKSIKSARQLICSLRIYRILCHNRASFSEKFNKLCKIIFLYENLQYFAKNNIYFVLMRNKMDKFIWNKHALRLLITLEEIDLNLFVIYNNAVSLNVKLRRRLQG